MARSINLRRGGKSSGNEIDCDLDLLPATIEQRSGPLMGLFFCLFALLWGGLPVVGMITAPEDFGTEEIVIASVFPVLGSGLFLWGLYMIRHRKTILLNATWVEVEEQNLFSQKRWSEPLAGYRGVLARTRRVSRSSKRGSHSYTLYEVVLWHDDKDKVITLFSSRRDKNWRRRWEYVAKKLDLTALDESAGGIVERQVEDLDKSVADLIDEGKVEVDYDRLQSRAEGIAVDIEGDEMVVTRKGPRNHPIGMLLLLSFPMIFIWLGFFHEDSLDFGPKLVGIFGLIMEVVVHLGVIWDLLSRERLRLGRHDFRSCSVSRWGETQGKRIAVADIETVKIGHKKNKSAGNALIIESDGGRLTYGQRLPQDTLAFLENLVLAKIDRSRD